ncbi:GNAT family N-acetyltransferase [Malaciobacter molluscorum LMG 25693]|uniref:Acetyltransferase n=1 Tax=Malaciobacter molluscorum LMG 25693 TaxID=870501 RepID=A0A2G1DJN9_9BACT|nr:GNAT family N-acetyltransferase [Malaciobacter molluscorum]AXX92883.1 acetyltransferase [Malaciobacter molluscorum LMG 25693]PHO18717.1 GNAT family N-acetyltransferase [Malaciobacter molluscorum LMG 25693]
MEILIKKFNELSNIELYEILRLRIEVFVVEQNCIYNDIDGIDIDSYHLLIKDNSKIVAYLRVYQKSQNEVSFGRVLVSNSNRGKGYAKKIIEEVLVFIEKTYKNKTIVIEAQTYLQNFYECFGFVIFSEEFLEDGIPHIMMKK